MDGAGTTAAARAMNVEEHDAVPLTNGKPVEPGDGPAPRIGLAGRDMSGNEGIWPATEAPMQEVHGGAAALREGRPEQHGARRQLGTSELPELDRLPRGGHDR